MAVPKHKTSKNRSRSRRAANMKLAAPTLVGCSNCGNQIVRHRVCPKCGFYRNKEVFKPEDMA
jgi:large subunit ribosomal protein L32